MKAPVHVTREGIAKPPASTPAPRTPPMSPRETILENAQLRLHLRLHEKGLFARLLDKTTAVEWPESPLVSACIYEKMERRQRRAACSVESIETEGTGCRLQFSLSYEEIAFAVRLGLAGGELQVCLPMVECYELRPRIARLMSVGVLPDLATVGADGQVLLPLHSGVLFSPAGKPALRDRFMIYGEQSRWELLPTLPVAGVAEGRSGLLLLATRGAPETECRVETDGRGQGTVAFGFCLRQGWPDPVCSDDREIRIVPFATRDQDLVHTAGYRLRRHLIEDLHKKTLAQRAAESPEIRQLLESHIIRIFHGMQPIGMAAGSDRKDGLSLQEPFVVDTTFREAQESLARLHEAGVARMHVESIGWNPRGHDGMWPTRFPVEPRVGGEAGFRELIRYGRSLGCTMNVHDNYLSQYNSSPDFDPSIVMHDQWGNRDLRGFWGGGETYVTCPWKLGPDRLEREMERVKGLGLNGAAYIDGMGNPLECGYAPGPVGTRSDYVRGSQHVLDAARQAYGAVRTECGFLYVCLPADNLATCGNSFMLQRFDPDWPVSALMERIVPVWQLALHGLIIRDGGGCTWRATMQCLLFGDHPRHEWTARGRFQPRLDDAMIAGIKAQYDLCIRRHGSLQTESLVSWQDLGEGVRETRFSDGTVVHADFRALTLTVNGEPIEPPPGMARGTPD